MLGWMIRKDQQHSLSSLVGITTATAALVLKARKSGYSALKIVGGVVVTPTMGCHSDLSALRAASPELCHAFNSPQTQSDAPAAIIHRSE